MSALYFPRNIRLGRYRPIQEARAAKKLEMRGMNINFEVTDENIRAEAMKSKSPELDSDAWPVIPPDAPPEAPPEASPEERPGRLKDRLNAKRKAIVQKFKSKIYRTKSWQ